MNLKLYRQWMWRLQALLECMRKENAEISGFTENLIPDTELWSKLDGINRAITAAQAEANRVEQDIQRELKEFESKI